MTTNIITTSSQYRLQPIQADTDAHGYDKDPRVAVPKHLQQRR
jgi:hypothetical protein